MKKEPLVEIIRQLIQENIVKNNNLLYPHNSQQLKEAVKRTIANKLRIVEGEIDE